ncbi:MAG: hypothetical protein ACPGJE_03095, partial [Wenzhouxiangellaceae bacterium]
MCDLRVESAFVGHLIPALLGFIHRGLNPVAERFPLVAAELARVFQCLFSFFHGFLSFVARGLPRLAAALHAGFGEIADFTIRFAGGRQCLLPGGAGAFANLRNGLASGFAGFFKLRIGRFHRVVENFLRRFGGFVGRVFDRYLSYAQAFTPVRVDALEISTEDLSAFAGDLLSASADTGDGE